MSLSQMARSIRESPTLKLNETAGRLVREKAMRLIHLGGGGEPKSKAPIDALVTARYLSQDPAKSDTLPPTASPLKKQMVPATPRFYDRQAARRT